MRIREIEPGKLAHIVDGEGKDEKVVAILMSQTPWDVSWTARLPGQNSETIASADSQDGLLKRIEKMRSIGML